MMRGCFIGWWGEVGGMSANQYLTMGSCQQRLGSDEKYTEHYLRSENIFLVMSAKPTDRIRRWVTPDLMNEFEVILGEGWKISVYLRGFALLLAWFSEWDQKIKFHGALWIPSSIWVVSIPCFGSCKSPTSRIMSGFKWNLMIDCKVCLEMCQIEAIKLSLKVTR